MRGSASTSSAARSAARAIVTHDRAAIPASAVTITLGSYCPTSRRSCDDRHVVHEGQERRLAAGRRRAAVHALAVLRRPCARAPGRRGRRISWTRPTRRASPRARSSTRSRVPAASSLTPATTGGTLGPGTYSYDVTAVLASGAEIPGTVASVTIASGLDEQDHAELVGLRASELDSCLVQRLRARRRRPAPAEERHVRHLIRRPRPDLAHGQPADAPERHDRRRRHVELQLGREYDHLRAVRASSRAPGRRRRASPAVAAASPASTRKTCPSTARRARARLE